MNRNNYLKNRIIIILVSILLLVIALFWGRLVTATREMLGLEYEMGVRVLSTDEMQQRISGKSALDNDAAATLVQQIHFEDYAVPYDIEEQSIFVPQSMSVSQWQGEFSGDFEVKLYWVESDGMSDKLTSIADGTTFTLYAISGDSYAIYNVTFSGMPVATLTRTETTDWNGNEAWDGTFTVATWDDDGEYSYQSSDMITKYRGATTLNFDKKGFRIKLDDSASYLGMRYSKNWVLNAIYDDPGLIHNELSYEIWNQIAATHESGNDYAIEQEYVEVVLDGDYFGVYALQERYDKDLLQLDDDDVFFKTFSREVPQDITTMLTWTFSMKYPDEVSEEAAEPMYEWCRTFWTEIGCRDYDEAQEIVDWTNQLDYTIFNTLTAGYDTARKNIVFVIRNDGDDYEIQSIPWDQNITWGIAPCEDGASNYVIYYPDSIQSDIQTDFGMAIYTLDEERAQADLSERWQELRESGIISVENIESILDDRFAYLYNSGAYARNYEKWPNGTDYWDDSYIYEFVESRIPYLDEVWSD